jgi:Flp pilus assembly protein TadG
VATNLIASMRALARTSRQRTLRRGGPADAASRSGSGQATAEFALVIGVLLFIMLGVVDLGRLVAMQSAVVTASREGARYGSAVGPDAAFSNTERYRNCLGIKDAAVKVSKALVTPNTILVSWDAGPPGTTIRHSCGAGNSNPDVATIQKFDRVVVQVDATFSPISAVRFVIPSVTVQSIDRRTIVKQ